MKPCQTRSVMLLVIAQATMPTAEAFSALSTFTKSHASPLSKSASMPRALSSNSCTWTMYGDPGKEEFNAWTVLSKTEKWITSTLSHLNSAAQASNVANSPNAYARKEVSYACESYKDTPMIAAGIFRRIKELRQMGEDHGQEQREELEQMSERERAETNPRTMRQTQVVVVPGSTNLMEDFTLFDTLIERINNARRSARDYVTDVRLAKLDDEKNAPEWSVAINCAHMHPKYGEKSPSQTLADLAQEEEEGEIDVNYKAYQESKIKARQSPFPTIVLEMRTLPPMDFGQSPESRPQETASADSSTSKEDEGVTAADVHKLEALFGKSATFQGEDNVGKNARETDNFYSILSANLQEVSALTPMQRAQNWMAENDPVLEDAGKVIASFTDTDSAHVDAAYEFVFINLAMLLASPPPVGSGIQIARQYLVMPRFLSCAATSLEKFKLQVEAIWKGWPELEDKKLTIETFHPEHIDPSKRSPVTVLVLQWAS